MARINAHTDVSSQANGTASRSNPSPTHNSNTQHSLSSRGLTVFAALPCDSARGTSRPLPSPNRYIHSKTIEKESQCFGVGPGGLIPYKRESTSELSGKADTDLQNIEFPFPTNGKGHFKKDDMLDRQSQPRPSFNSLRTGKGM